MKQTKEQKRNYKKNYYLKNKTKLNEYQKKHQREKKKIALELNNCSKCFGEKEDKNRKTCRKCRSYVNKYNQKPKVKKYHKKYNKDNKERINKQMIKYFQKNKEERLDYQKEYFQRKYHGDKEFREKEKERQRIRRKNETV